MYENAEIVKPAPNVKKGESMGLKSRLCIGISQ